MKEKVSREKVFRALANPLRLEIIRLLQKYPLCVKALVARIKVTQAAVSQHLRILENAGLVMSRKQGYWKHYSLFPSGLKVAIRFLHQVMRNQGGEKKCPGRKAADARREKR